jgi:ubiquinone/menaquinone biosynthesis C-methylase UbiE
VVVPDYLEKTYWWAYTHPNAVRVFERQWLVNLILWGNFAKLRDLALDALTPHTGGRILQVACVYGNFTQSLARRMHGAGSLTVVDVAPVQITNLHAKLRHEQVPLERIHIAQQDATALQFATASQDATVLFFLLHEMPEDVRRQALAQALRVTKPGGKLVLVDYHRPRPSNPFRYVMVPILTLLEPFAMDLWRHDISHWLPAGLCVSAIRKQTFFGGLYQLVEITR